MSSNGKPYLVSPTYMMIDWAPRGHNWTIVIRTGIGGTQGHRAGDVQMFGQ